MGDQVDSLVSPQTLFNIPEASVVVAKIFGGILPGFWSGDRAPKFDASPVEQPISFSIPDGILRPFPRCIKVEHVYFLFGIDVKHLGDMAAIKEF